MNSKTGKLFVVESDEALREQIVLALTDAGYEVSTNYREGMKAVLAFNPDAVVLGADPPQLDQIILFRGDRHSADVLSVDRYCENTAARYGNILVEHTWIYGAALDLSKYTSSISSFRVQYSVSPALISTRLHLGVEVASLTNTRIVLV